MNAFMEMKCPVISIYCIMLLDITVQGISCHGVDIDFVGHDLGAALPNLSARECAEACISNDDCLSFAYEHVNSTCYLKGIVGTASHHADHVYYTRGECCDLLILYIMQYK